MPEFEHLSPKILCFIQYACYHVMYKIYVLAVISLQYFSAVTYSHRSTLCLCVYKMLVLCHLMMGFSNSNLCYV